jgi:hypothetical protein
VISYHWLNGNYDRIPSIMADLVRRRVSPGGGSPIPIIFGVGENPVSAGLVASATGRQCNWDEFFHD